MDSLAHYPIKSEWRANAVYLCPPANTARTKHTIGLGSTALGAKWGHNSGYQAAAGRTNKVSFLPTAYTPFREQKVKRHPLKLNYLREHIYHNLKIVNRWIFLAGARAVKCPTHNGFININIAIPDF